MLEDNPNITNNLNQSQKNHKNYTDSIRQKKYEAHKFQKNMMSIYANNQNLNDYQFNHKLSQQCNKKNYGSQGKFTKLQVLNKKINTGNTQTQEKKQNSNNSNSNSNSKAEKIDKVYVQTISVVNQEEIQNWEDIWNMLENKDNDNDNDNDQKDNEATTINNNNNANNVNNNNLNANQNAKANLNKQNEQEVCCQLTEEELMEIFGQPKKKKIQIEEYAHSEEDAQSNCRKHEIKINQLSQQQKQQCEKDKSKSKSKQITKLKLQQNQVTTDEDLLQIWNQLQQEQKNKILQTQQQRQKQKQKQIKPETQHKQIKKQKSDNSYNSQQIYTFSPSLYNYQSQKHIPKQQQQQQLQNLQKSQQKQNQTDINIFQMDEQIIIEDTPLNQQMIINQIKRECYNQDMIKLIYSEDFVVHNFKQFCMTPYKSKTYTYFGFKEQIYDNKVPFDKKYFMYSFQTREDILVLEPQTFSPAYIDDLLVRKRLKLATGHEVIKKVMEFDTSVCYKVKLVQTGERIATLFWKKVKDGLVFELKIFDSYEQKHTQSLAIIQVKDGFVAQSCYCDTNVYISNSFANTMSKGEDPYKPSIQKLKMILNIRNNKLTANMGINGIQSSPYNCCLQNKHKSFMYLMGNFKSDNFEKYIIKVGQGLSPLIGMAIAAGRKLYIDSFQ